MRLKFQNLVFDIFCNMLIEDIKTPFHYDYMKGLNLLDHAVCVSAMSGDNIYKYVKIIKDNGEYHVCYGLIIDNGHRSSLVSIDYLMYANTAQVENFIKAYRLDVPATVCERKTLIKVIL